MKVLITGHVGFIGGHFFRHYQNERHDVLGIDIAHPINPNDARGFFQFNEDRFDLIIHCAAIVGGRKMIDGNPLGVAVDLAIDAEMFQWALRTNVGRVVYFSSSAAYPVWMQNGSFFPLKEADIEFRANTVGVPDMSYGWTKLTGEYQAQFLQAEGIPTHIFRPFSGYGSDQALDYPFPSFIDRGKRKADPFEIWGDGTQERDFVHVDDVMATVLAAIDEDLTFPLNIGTGRGTSFNELAKLVCAEAGYEPEIKHLEANPVGVHQRVADTKLLNTLRAPRISLEEGIARAFRDG